MVVDFHGWGGNANSQEKDSQFVHVADEDPEGFLVASAQGMSDMNGRKFMLFRQVINYILTQNMDGGASIVRGLMAPWDHHVTQTEQSGVLFPAMTHALFVIQ